MASSSAQLASHAREPAFQIERDDAGRGLRLILTRKLVFADVTQLWDALRVLLRESKKRERIDLDMQHVEFLDGGAMALLAHFRSEVYRRGGRAEFINATESAQEIIHLYRGDQAVKRRKK